MAVEVYPLELEHPQHGRKAALTRREAELDKRNGWVEKTIDLPRFPNKLTALLNRMKAKKPRLKEAI